MPKRLKKAKGDSKGKRSLVSSPLRNEVVFPFSLSFFFFPALLLFSSLKFIVLSSTRRLSKGKWALGEKRGLRKSLIKFYDPFGTCTLNSSNCFTLVILSFFLSFLLKKNLTSNLMTKKRDVWYCMAILQQKWHGTGPTVFVLFHGVEFSFSFLGTDVGYYGEVWIRALGQSCGRCES